jgi:hypothetical protein
LHLPAWRSRQNGKLFLREPLGRLANFRKGGCFQSTESNIFETIRDSRSNRQKLCAGIAGTLLNVFFLGALAILSQIGAARHASSRLQNELRRELSQYRLVLIAPRIPAPNPPPRTTPIRERPARRQKPLAVPDPRLLNEMTPDLAAFIRENEAIENILTREVARDLGARAIDVMELLQKCNIQISFDIDSGHISRRKVERSSGMPSVDHLLIELITLLDKYQLLAFFGDIRHVVASAIAAQEIEVKLIGEVDTAKPENMRGQIEAGLILWRTLLAPEDSELLEDIAVVSEENRIIVTKSLPRDAVLDLVRRYIQTGEPK